MNSKQEVVEFDAALIELSREPKTIELIQSLVNVFDDQCKHLEVMWGLIHFIETFPQQLLIDTIVSQTSALHHQALGWLRNLYGRLLRGETTKEIFITSVRRLPEEDRHYATQIINSLIDDKSVAIKLHLFD